MNIIIICFVTHIGKTCFTEPGGAVVVRVLDSSSVFSMESSLSPVGPLGTLVTESAASSASPGPNK